MIPGAFTKILFKFPGKTAMLGIAHFKGDICNSFFSGRQQFPGLLKPTDAQIVKNTGAIGLPEAGVQFIFIDTNISANVL